MRMEEAVMEATERERRGGGRELCEERERGRRECVCV